MVRRSNRVQIDNGKWPAMNYAAAVAERDADNTAVISSELLCESVTGRVKWYDAAKGYGFVHLADRGVDAMLHANAIENIASADLQIGATVDCEVIPTPKGLRVARISRIDLATADPDAFAPKRPVTMAGPMFAAVVKWYKLIEGFGFFYDPKGGGDIFIHAGILEHHGIKTILEGQTWLIGVVDGAKGRMVGSIARF
ncbi:Cold-shock DNA-binding domain protein (plasmid) [Bosea sp. RAC05]|nr:Cold-shock DNA-binding domain protein [Bosea sp. RAC05]